MEYQAFVNTVSVPCCVLSVEKMATGECGIIRIIAANESYRQVMGPAYYDNMEYSELVPKDLKFEDFCYRAAVLGQRMHAYVETRALGCWTDQQMIPLKSEQEGIGYCLFLFEFTKEAEPGRMSSVSLGIASTVIQCSLRMLALDNIQEGIQYVTRQILDFSEAKHCRVMLINDETREAINFCEMYTPEYDGEGATIPYETMKSWEAMIGVSNGVIVKNEHEMQDLERRNPVWVSQMRSYGVTSLAMVPMRRDKRILGYIYVINYNIEKTVEVKELLEILSYIVGAEVENYLLVQRLEQMSQRDELTGIMNRNALRRRIKEMSHDRSCMPMGVVYMDVNGLKKVNDQKGHEAGDTLIRHAVQMMERAYDHTCLYRAGGDEFIAVMENCNREQFEHRVAHFRQLEKSDPMINIAIGAYWSDDLTEDVQHLFRVADEQMYMDKRLFYNRHPEMNRRNR